jgi:hypothetical protein
LDHRDAVVPGESVETGHGEAPLAALVGTENRGLELTIRDSLHILEGESSLTADRSEALTHLFVV